MASDFDVDDINTLCMYTFLFLDKLLDTISNSSNECDAYNGYDVNNMSIKENT